MRAGRGREVRPARLTEDFIERVLECVESIPPGQVATYGDIAELLEEGGPRLVGQVMSRHGAGVPWWRIVRASGLPPEGLKEEALRHLEAENVPLRDGRVDLRKARMRTAD